MCYVYLQIRGTILTLVLSLNVSSVMSEGSRCPYGYFIMASSACQPDVQVIVSKLNHSQAYCNYHNGYYNKEGVMFFSTDRDYKQLCICGDLKCEKGSKVLPGKVSNFVSIFVTCSLFVGLKSTK